MLLSDAVPIIGGVIGANDLFDPITVRIKPDFKVETDLSLSWGRLSNYNYFAIDRGAGSDTYESEFTMYAKQAEINTFLDHLNAPDTYGYHKHLTVKLNTFSDTEHIFGEDVDYSKDIYCEILDISDISQKSWQTRELSVKIRALSPSFTGTPALPDCKSISVGVKTKVEYGIRKVDTYDGTFTVYEDILMFDAKTRGAGLITFKCTLPLSEVKSFRRYIATQRGNTISIPDLPGITYPFGPNRPSTYPLSVKIINWKDIGWLGVGHRVFEVTLAEVV